ncbi:hypothetical protein EVAR_77409_1 [Eumeta japonica]|uniref:Uncharacterized protein n=1 Tax=Eumeta variegata TaxID=151549 RepID=A0A4C1UX82_EUMVA|nr:hypothetical protein EVAR_77409_1 [Eumeta japonica]
MAEQITMRLSLRDTRAYCATFRIEVKVEPQSRTGPKLRSGLGRGRGADRYRDGPSVIISKGGGSECKDRPMTSTIEKILSAALRAEATAGRQRAGRGGRPARGALSAEDVPVLNCHDTVSTRIAVSARRIRCTARTAPRSARTGARGGGTRHIYLRDELERPSPRSGRNRLGRSGTRAVADSSEEIPKYLMKISISGVELMKKTEDGHRNSFNDNSFTSGGTFPNERTAVVRRATGRGAGRGARAARPRYSMNSDMAPFSV